MEIWGNYFPYEVKNTYMNVFLPSACEEMCALCFLDKHRHLGHPRPMHFFFHILRLCMCLCVVQYKNANYILENLYYIHLK